MEQRGEKRQYQDETKEISSGTHHSEDGVHTHNTSNEDEEGIRRRGGESSTQTLSRLYRLSVIMV
jgi:hypothetical protein